jgi:hypothetical protein
MLLSMHEDGGPFGESWGVGGVGGRATAEHTIRPQEKVCFLTYINYASALHPLSLPPFPYLVSDLAFFYTFP